MQALRDGRPTRYIPDSILPRNPSTGEVLQSNAFDNSYIKTDDDLSENRDNKIDLVQPAILHDSYLSTYVTENVILNIDKNVKEEPQCT